VSKETMHAKKKPFFHEDLHNKPTKESDKRDLQKKPIQDLYIDTTNQQKRPVKETCKGPVKMSLPLRLQKIHNPMLDIFSRAFSKRAPCQNGLCL